MSEAKGLLYGALIVLALFCAFFLVAGLPVYVLGYLDCNGYERATGKATKYVMGTCYIQDGGQWFAWEEYKNRFVAGGMLFQGK